MNATEDKYFELVAQLEAVVLQKQKKLTSYSDNLERAKKKIARARIKSIPITIYSTELQTKALQKAKLSSIEYKHIVQIIHTDMDEKTMIIVVKGTGSIPLWIIAMRFKDGMDFDRALMVMKKRNDMSTMANNQLSQSNMETVNPQSLNSQGIRLNAVVLYKYSTEKDFEINMNRLQLQMGNENETEYLAFIKNNELRIQLLNHHKCTTIFFNHILKVIYDEDQNIITIAYKQIDSFAIWIIGLRFEKIVDFKKSLDAIPKLIYLAKQTPIESQPYAHVGFEARLEAIVADQLDNKLNLDTKIWNMNKQVQKSNQTTSLVYIYKKELFIESIKKSLQYDSIRKLISTSDEGRTMIYILNNDWVVAMRFQKKEEFNKTLEYINGKTRISGKQHEYVNMKPIPLSSRSISSIYSEANTSYVDNEFMLQSSEIMHSLPIQNLSSELKTNEGSLHFAQTGSSGNILSISSGEMEMSCRGWSCSSYQVPMYNSNQKSPSVTNLPPTFTNKLIQNQKSIASSLEDVSFRKSQIYSLKPQTHSDQFNIPTSTTPVESRTNGKKMSTCKIETRSRFSEETQSLYHSSDPCLEDSGQCQYKSRNSTQQSSSSQSPNSGHKIFISGSVERLQRK